MLSLTPTQPTQAIRPTPQTERAASDAAAQPASDDFAQALGDAVEARPATPNRPARLDKPLAKGGPVTAAAKASAAEPGAPGAGATDTDTDTGTDSDTDTNAAPANGSTRSNGGAPTDAPSGSLAALLAQWQHRPQPPEDGAATRTPLRPDADDDSPTPAARVNKGAAQGARGLGAIRAGDPGDQTLGDGLAQARPVPRNAEDTALGANGTVTPTAAMATAAAVDPTPPLPTSLPQTAAGAPGTSAAAPVETRLAAGPASADFGAQLSAQITTFVRDGVEHARLHLNPADMGPVQVTIQVDGGTAAVHLSADSAQTRQALEQALPMLAGSLREEGLTLTGGGVSQQARQDAGNAQTRQDDPTRGDTRPANGAAQDSADRAAPPGQRRGIVDLVA